MGEIADVARVMEVTRRPACMRHGHVNGTALIVCQQLSRLLVVVHLFLGSPTSMGRTWVKVETGRGTRQEGGVGDGVVCILECVGIGLLLLAGHEGACAMMAMDVARVAREGVVVGVADVTRVAGDLSGRRNVVLVVG